MVIGKSNFVMARALCAARNKQYANRNIQDGFTLIEIMVSIAILSSGLVLILQGFTHSLNALAVSENNLKATLLAEEKVTQMQISAKQSKDAFLRGLDGQTSFDSIKYKWETKVTADEKYEYLNKVLTIISWEEGRRKGSVPVVTYLRIPLNEGK